MIAAKTLERVGNTKVKTKTDIENLRKEIGEKEFARLLAEVETKTEEVAQKILQEAHSQIG